MKHDEAVQGVVDAYARYDTAKAVAKDTHEAWSAAYAALQALRRRSAFLGPDSNPAHDRETNTACARAAAQKTVERATQALVQAARALYESQAKIITKTEATTEVTQAAQFHAGTKVFIYYNDEAGCWQYSVACDAERDNWIWSYKSRVAAEAACKKYGWEIVG